MGRATSVARASPTPIEHPRDEIVKVSCCAICGSDRHIYGGIIPLMHEGDIDPSFVVTAAS